jgi:hypothetical protein
MMADLENEKAALKEYEEVKKLNQALKPLDERWRQWKNAAEICAQLPLPPRIVDEDEQSFTIKALIYQVKTAFFAAGINLIRSSISLPQNAIFIVLGRRISIRKIM